jgi:type I restriction enzyme S subunit
MLNTTVQSTLNLSDLRRLGIPMPPEKVRLSITDVLGALDDKIVANRASSSAANTLAAATYGAGVGDIENVPMSTALNPILGGTPARATPAFWDGGIPWASVRDITASHNGVLLTTAESISDEATRSGRLRPIRAGSVLLSARGTVGEVARLATAAAFNQSCYGFEPASLPASVLYFAILRATQRAKAIAHGSVFSTITRRSFDHLEVPDPTDPRIGALEAKLQPILALIDQLVRESAVLEVTRDALLPLLMSGQLRVMDAEVVAGRGGL